MRKYRNVVTDETNNALYGIWQKMNTRCYDENCKRYADYGGRGIYVCDEWRNDFDAFADWGKENGYYIGMTIDRIDVDGNYEPGNCRWQTRKEQNRNKRLTKSVVYNGVEKPLIDWCEELNISYDTTHDRIYKRGWSVEDAFTKKSQQEDSFDSRCRAKGLNPNTVRSRMKKFGWSEERALNTPSLGRGKHPNGEYKDRKIEAVCKICGNVFIKKSAKQIYCGEKCRSKAKQSFAKERNASRG